MEWRVRRAKVERVEYGRGDRRGEGRGRRRKLEPDELVEHADQLRYERLGSAAGEKVRELYVVALLRRLHPKGWRRRQHQ